MHTIWFSFFLDFLKSRSVKMIGLLCWRSMLASVFPLMCTSFDNTIPGRGPTACFSACFVFTPFVCYVWTTRGKKNIYLIWIHCKVNLSWPTVRHFLILPNKYKVYCAVHKTTTANLRSSNDGPACLDLTHTHIKYACKTCCNNMTDGKIQICACIVA